MKYIPYACTVTVIGILLTVRGIVLWEIWLNMAGDALIIFGLLWLFWACDKHKAEMKALRRLGRKLEELNKNQVETDITVRAANRKADEAKEEARKAHGQTVKGKCVVLHKYPGKEETA